MVVTGFFAQCEDGYNMLLSYEDKATTLYNFLCGVFTKQNVGNIPSFEDRHSQELLSNITLLMTMSFKD